MAQYQIVCTTQQPFGQPANHAHIIAVGTGSAAGYDKYWTLEQVIQAMANGDVFYTVSPSTGAIALVEPFKCANCNKYFIRSKADAVTDNNLDSLPFCRI